MTDSPKDGAAKTFQLDESNTKNNSVPSTEQEKDENDVELISSLNLTEKADINNAQNVNTDLQNSADDTSEAELINKEEEETATTEFVSVPNFTIKDEQSFVADETTIMNLHNIDNERDPMNLLEPTTRPNYINDRDTEGESSCDNNDDDETSSSSAERTTKADTWQRWMDEYKWLLHEKTDNNIGYCLYCNVKINVNTVKAIKSHGTSLYHQEREENYLAFKRTEEQQGTGSNSEVYIKQEFGTDSNIAALKFKRIAQTESLNNFMWLRWTKAHEWLVREMDEGTIGFCKYCRMRVNAEFTYLRKRHEMSIKHTEAERNYKKRLEKGRKRKHSELDAENESHADGEDDVENEDVDVEPAQEVVEEDKDRSQTLQDSNPKDNWLEEVPGTSYLVYCKFCKCKMIKTSARKHLKSKIHLANLKLLGTQKSKKIKAEFKNGFNWKMYARKHPWIAADPEDPSYAYCNICEKRFMYGHSMPKRKAHENGANHKNAAKQQEDQANDNSGEDNESAAEANEGTENSEEPEETDEENVEKEFKSKRPAKLSDDWYESAQYPWCKKYTKDSKYMLCSYCNVTLSVNFSRWKHQKTVRHIAAEKEVFANRSKKTKTVTHYSWLSYSKNRKLSFCKYCRVRFPNEKSKHNHEHTNRHKVAVRQFLTKQSKKKKNSTAVRSESIDTESASNCTTDSAEQLKASTNDSAAKVKETAADKPKVAETKSAAPLSMQGKVMLWKSRFPWLSYKRNELRPNYGWCKLCEQSIFMPTHKFASKHQRSGKHIRLRALMKRESRANEEQKENHAKNNESIASTKSPTNKEKGLTSKDKGSTNKEKESTNKEKEATLNEKESFDEMKRQYSWLVPDDSDPKYCHCMVCNIRLPFKSLFMRQHHKSKKHVAAVQSQTLLINPANNSDDNNDQMDSDVVVVLEDDENDDILSIKSESTDVLVERVLQRTRETINDEATIEPPAKQRKTTNDVATNKVRNVADSRPELLRVIRSMNNGRTNELSSSSIALAESLLTSSFSIAACLTPLMQQQSTLATSQANPQTPPQPTSSTPVSNRNTFDLFFDSVSETLKSLPSDLAAEGKMKVMQIIYDLEVRAMRRKTNNDSNNKNNEDNATPTAANNENVAQLATTTDIRLTPTEDHGNASDTLIISPSSSSGSEAEESVLPHDKTNGSTGTGMMRVLNIDKNNSSTPITTQLRTIRVANDKSSVELPKQNSADNNIMRLQIPSTIQISTRNEPSKLRCVPLTTLTGITDPAKIAALKKNTQATVSITPVTTTAPNRSVVDSNGTRQIIVNSSTQSKFITVGGSSVNTQSPARNNSQPQTTAVQIRRVFK